MIGRTYADSLGAGGEAGVAKALDILGKQCSPPWDCAASTRLLRSTITCWRFEAASALVKNHEGELRLFKSDSDGSIFELAMPVGGGARPRSDHHTGPAGHLREAGEREFNV